MGSHHDSSGSLNENSDGTGGEGGGAAATAAAGKGARHRSSFIEREGRRGPFSSSFAIILLSRKLALSISLERVPPTRLYSWRFLFQLSISKMVAGRPPCDREVGGRAGVFTRVGAARRRWRMLLSSYCLPVAQDKYSQIIFGFA